MNTIPLTTEQLKTLTEYVSLSNKLDTKSITIFEICLDNFLVNKGTKKETIKGLLKKQFNKVFKDTKGNLKVSAYIVSKLLSIIDIACNYSTFNITYKNKEGEAILYYSNIEAIIKLLQFVSDNEDDIVSDFKTIRNQIEEALISDVSSKVTYNNNIKDVLTKIKQENNIKGQDDALAFKGDYSALLAMIKSQFKGDISKLIKDLSETKE